MELAISIFVGVLLVEAYAWLPRISEWLVERAVSQLRAEHQARCREEWKASLDALPNSGVKLLHAFSFLSWAAARINADSIEAELEEIGRQLQDLSVSHTCTLQQMRTLRAAAAGRQVSRQTLEHLVGESVVSLRAIKAPDGNVPGHVADAVNAFQGLGHGLIAALNRVTELTDRRILRFSVRLEQVESQLRTAIAKHAVAEGLFRKRKLSSTEFVLVLDDLHAELHALSAMIEGDVVDVEDDVEAREGERIMIALTKVIKTPLPRTTTGSYGSRIAVGTPVTEHPYRNPRS